MESPIRRARIEEADSLSDIAYRSKAYWGYDEAYMESARQDLRVAPEHIVDNTVFVLEDSGQLQGFYELRANNNREVELFWLFVDPLSIGKGYGKKLMLHAIQTAIDAKFVCMKIKSDPNAAGFYSGFGAKVVGEASSSVRPEMKLPVFHLSLN